MPQQLLLTRKSKFCVIERKLLGLSSRQPLLNTMWLSNTIHFGLRGCKEQRELQWGDIALKTDSEEKEFLEYFERQTKTRTGVREDPRNLKDQLSRECTPTKLPSPSIVTRYKDE